MVLLMLVIEDMTLNRIGLKKMNIIKKKPDCLKAKEE
jgi:hypothetical protein